MRITNQMMQKASLSQIQGNMRQIADATQKVSTGKRLQKTSDDPTASAGAMRTRGSLRGVEQYQRGVEAADSRARAEEAALDQLTNMLARAKELATTQASATASAQTRNFTKAEIDQLLEQAVSLGNSRFENSYLFGGVNADSRPLVPDTAPTSASGFLSNATGEHRIEVSEGQFLKSAHNASEVFVDTEVLSSLRSLSNALGSNDPAAITASIGSLDTAFNGVQALLGDVGARTNQLDATRGNLEAMKTNLQIYQSTLEDAGIEEAMSELVNRQTTYQAAMLATSRVMGLTLADYLR